MLVLFVLHIYRISLKFNRAIHLVKLFLFNLRHVCCDVQYVQYIFPLWVSDLLVLDKQHTIMYQSFLNATNCLLSL